MTIQVRTRLLAAACVAAAMIYGAASLKAAAARDVARGKYLVHNVAMCVDCHGPDLKGAALPFKAADPKMPFVSVAPSLRGAALKHYSEADLARALSTGKRPQGSPFLPPMPHYRMNSTDAAAVAAYIKSLK